MKASYKLIFARKGLDDKGTGLVQIQIYFSRKKRKLINTRIRISKDQWDPVRDLIKAGDDKDLAEKHELVMNKIRELEAFEMKLIRKGEELTPGKVDEFLEMDKQDTFNAFMEAELKADKVLKYGTSKQHWITWRKLNEMEPAVGFQDIGYDLVKRWDNFLHTKSLSTNTIADHHKNLRRYINIAIKKNLIRKDQNPYGVKFKAKKEPVKRTSLSDDELVSLEQIDYTRSKKLDKIRDLFLFCCYTGLRFSDLMELQVSHLQKTREGYEIALHRMVKVAQPVFIPLHAIFKGKAERILEKYIGDGGYVFPRVTNQKANEYLKTIILDAKITKRVTWHTARHTFGSQLAARYNDPYLIMQLMGHQEIKTSMVYIHSSQDIIKKKLKKVKW